MQYCTILYMSHISDYIVRSLAQSLYVQLFSDANFAYERLVRPDRRAAASDGGRAAQRSRGARQGSRKHSHAVRRRNGPHAAVFIAFSRFECKSTATRIYLCFRSVYKTTLLLLICTIHTLRIYSRVNGGLNQTF